VTGDLSAMVVQNATVSDEIAWSVAALSSPLAAPAVRIWRYGRPAVVLGPAQRPDEGMKDRALAAGVELVQRPAGGGAVLAGPWLLGASILLPPGHRRVPASIPASYGWLGTLFVDWLAGIGIDASAAPAPVRAEATLAWSCFAGLSHGEVVVRGSKKIVGLAQARRRNGTLFSTGVLLARSPWPVLCAVLGRPPEQAEELARTTTSVQEENGADVGDELQGRLLMALFEAAGG
jgi:lipoate---protein ligase